MNILVEITYDNNAEATTSPQKHMLLLKAMGAAFDPTELIIYDMKNCKLTMEEWKATTGIGEYKKRFKIHQGNGRHYVIFRVLATIGFQQLKRDPQVLKQLKATECYMKRHLWPEDKWDIVTMGFLVELDPGRMMADEVRQTIVELAEAKECITDPGTRFKLVAQRFKLRHNGTTCNADAYGVQCMRIDAQQVDKLLKITYGDTHTYVKNKLRKKDPKAYLNALRLQNKYVATVKTILLVGVTRKTMKDLRPILLSDTNIHHVSSTHKSDSIGRWDIITNETNMARSQV
jgi:hypothetical protein